MLWQADSARPRSQYYAKSASAVAKQSLIIFPLGWRSRSIIRQSNGSSRRRIGTVDLHESREMLCRLRTRGRPV